MKKETRRIDKICHAEHTNQNWKNKNGDDEKWP